MDGELRGENKPEVVARSPADEDVAHAQGLLLGQDRRGWGEVRKLRIIALFDAREVIADWVPEITAVSLRLWKLVCLGDACNGCVVDRRFFETMIDGLLFMELHLAKFSLYLIEKRVPKVSFFFFLGTCTLFRL